MNTRARTPEQLYDRDVLDAEGNKLGTVDGVWVDDASGELEFIGVKTGWIGGKTHVVPTATAQIGNDQIRVPYNRDQITDAPTFETDVEFSPTDEERIYTHFRFDRSTAGPTGLSQDGRDTQSSDTGGATDRSTKVETTADYATRHHADTADDQSITLSEEELLVGKRQVELGRVRIRKVVRTEIVRQPVELRHEEVYVERISASGADVPADAFEEREIDVPVMQEEPVVEKRAHITGRVQVNRDVQTETRNIEGEVRKEDVEIDRDRL